MNFGRRWRRRERGQAMIFVAILLPLLSMTTGLVVEGGRVFVEYRKLQAAADMAAIVGAQKLPCATTDTNCISTAETDACTWATNNGFSGCVAGGTSVPSSNVPPVTCSPYDFLDYGNGSTNASCTSASAPPYYDYIEVRLSDSVGVVPIFNVNVTLSAHAVAKHGIPSGKDYAILSLDPSTVLNMFGSVTVNTVGSNFANGGVSGNGNGETACDGGWFSENGTVTGVSTNTGGAAQFAPTGCSGTNDGTPLTASGDPQVYDPYSGSVAPATVGSTGGTMTNCSECSQAGWWYDGSSWHQGGVPTTNGSGGTIELFPGVYDSLSFGNKDNAYFNPGIYTFTTNGVDTNHGNMCVFGSPSCLQSSCATASFSAGSSAGDQWYYSCSPFGYWDTSTFGGTRPSSLPTTPPYFYGSTTPLNGVVFYIPSTASNGVTTHGNSGSNGMVYLAAPNPCPGTGSFTSSPGAVSFTAGSTSGVYSYGSTNLAYKRGFTSSSAGVVYPSEDFSLLGECNNGLQAWNGEMPTWQHLQFFLYDLSSADNTLNGASAQNLTGIVYMPNSSTSITGAGKGAGGPPWIDGQLVVKSAGLGGNGYVDVSYRGCAGGSTPCGSGGGTQLIQ